MKQRLIVIIALILSFSFVLTGCGRGLHEIAPSTTEGAEDHKINGTAFEFTPSDDRALQTDLGGWHVNERLRYSGGYVYFGTLNMTYRYNPETGISTPLCDLLGCRHNTVDCPLLGIQSTQVVFDNKIYFQQRYDYTVREAPDQEPVRYFADRYSLYDFETKTLTPICDRENGFYSQEFYGNYRYYLKTTIDENNTFYFSVCRQDMTTLETTTFKDFGRISPGICEVTEDRIYLADETHFYYCYLDDPETEFYLSKGNYIYCLFDESHLFITYDEDDPKVLVRMDHDGNDPTVLVENIDRYCLTESYVYFNYKEYKTVGTDKNGKPIRVTDGKIYRIPKTGGEPELVFEFPEEMSHYSFVWYLVDGNYLYASYRCYDEESEELWESYSHGEFDFLRINLLTKELYYIGE